MLRLLNIETGEEDFGPFSQVDNYSSQGYVVTFPPGYVPEGWGTTPEEEE